MAAREVDLSAHPSTRILKVYVEVLNGVQSHASLNGLNNTLLSLGHILEMAPSMRTVGSM